jgi:hypothetical protein
MGSPGQTVLRHARPQKVSKSELPLNLYNNLAKPLCTVCAVSISSQTSGPRPPKILHADSKLDLEGRRHKFFFKNISRKIFLNFFFCQIFLGQIFSGNRGA